MTSFVYQACCFSVSTLVEDLDAQTTLAKAIQEGRLDEVEKVGWDGLGWIDNILLDWTRKRSQL